MTETRAAQSPAKGWFITFEGGEGAGKSTQVQALAKALAATTGRSMTVTREPGGSPGSEEIRKLLVSGEATRWSAMSEALLHFAARRDHLERTIWPALEAGNIVICDRFTDSTLAYQGVAQGLGHSAVETLRDLVVGGFAPDLTFILDLPFEMGLQRARDRGGDDRYERLGEDFHRKLNQAFRAIAAANPRRCVLVDATESAEAIARIIQETVVRRMAPPDAASADE
ncbi:MAG: dTMP kinase [Alphaproteobacteria bacterium]